MSKNFVCEEIYPRILVYRNLFDDNSRMYDIAKKIINVDEGTFFPTSIDWYVYGKKSENPPIQFDRSAMNLVVENCQTPQDKDQEDQYYFATELVRLFHEVNNDYAKRYGIDLSNEKSQKITTKEYGESKEWHFLGPTLCMYNENAGQISDLAMKYHTDYILEPMSSPGYKFAITTTIYLNDDYDGGDLDFLIDNKLINYKPQAGDFVVFPSGHPEYLTEDGNIYLHSVRKCFNNKKYFVRMFWQKYQVGSKEWYNQEETFGKEAWEKMYQDQLIEYREKHPQREVIKGGVRLK